MAGACAVVCYCWAVLTPCADSLPLLLRLQEYTRAAHVLSSLESSVALFLRCYALFLAGEKQKE